ncbi:hypothetical protein OPQ81_002891 [Rhizoctonia solani]|nr:hypothetical protein OPQ81_002891 [Rhizoctonia solani]
MVQTPCQPAFVQIPCLQHQYSLTTSFRSQGNATSPRRNSQSKVGTEQAGPSRGHAGYQPAICERRASNPDTSCYPYLPAEHATYASVQPATRFEVASPKRKAHYVPATPPRPPQRVPTTGLNIPRRHSSEWNPYPSPPNSPPSERAPGSPRKQAPKSPKQSHIPSPPPSPKRPCTPAPKPHILHSPISSEDDIKEGDELLSKFRRFALAARETPSDEKCIEDLMDSYDELMPSLIEEVAVDPRVDVD